MEIRQNPYEDFEDMKMGNNQDKTFEFKESPFDDDLGNLQVRQAPKVPTLGKVAPSQEIPALTSKPEPFKKAAALQGARQKVKIAKLGVPSLDLSTLKNVKEYKDWYGYSQKLENAIRLMREKIEAQENEINMRDLHIIQLEKEVENLKAQNKRYAQQNKTLNEKYQDTLNQNFKSQRAQDLEPMYKPIHSKTMSLVGMLKQYATTGGMGASNDATERIGQALKQDSQPKNSQPNKRYGSPEHPE